MATWEPYRPGMPPILEHGTRGPLYSSFTHNITHPPLSFRTTEYPPYLFQFVTPPGGIYFGKLLRGFTSQLLFRTTLITEAPKGVQTNPYADTYC